MLHWTWGHISFWDPDFNDFWLIEIWKKKYTDVGLVENWTFMFKIIKSGCLPYIILKNLLKTDSIPKYKTWNFKLPEENTGERRVEKQQGSQEMMEASRGRVWRVHRTCCLFRIWPAWCMFDLARVSFPAVTLFCLSVRYPTCPLAQGTTQSPAWLRTWLPFLTIRAVSPLAL